MQLFPGPPNWRWTVLLHWCCSRGWLWHGAILIVPKFGCLAQVGRTCAHFGLESICWFEKHLDLLRMNGWYQVVPKLFYLIRVKAEKPSPGDANWQGSAEVQPLNPAVVTPRHRFRWRNVWCHNFWVSCWMTAIPYTSFLSSSFDGPNVWKD